jgi:hypothetical protein
MVATMVAMTAAAPLALTSQERNYWTVIIVLGFVVILAVVALLSLLVWFVRTIDRRVVEIRETLESIEGNTVHTSLIEPTAERVENVLAEGLQHHLFLGRVYGKVRA